MNKNTFSERLKLLRSSMNKTQKEFADFVEIPQPTISSYENGKNNPTIDVVNEIADKCNVSIDWLCGRNNISNLTDLSSLIKFFYDLYETKEIKFETIIHDHRKNDLNTKEERENCWVQLKFYWNDNFPYNASICNIIKRVYEQHLDLESYTISKENYDSERKKWINYYSKNSLSLTKEEYPELTREERLKKHIEYLKKII